MRNIGTKRLLILDDSEDLLWILKIFFEGKGHVVKSICDGDEVNSAIGSFHPHLLLLDVVLNGNDGRALCKELKGHSETSHMGILLTSASPENLKNYKTYQADDYIEKPFDLNLLEQKINSMLTRLELNCKQDQ